MEKKLKVAVLMGGRSSEHDVSLKTGEAIIKFLNPARYTAVPLVVPKDGAFPYEQLRDAKPDVAFIALHGKWGEDGTVQGLLELMDIPYTGSGVLGSALAMDKIRSMDLFQFHGFSVPEYISLTAVEFEKKAQDVASAVRDSLGFPCVIKPSDGGSSVGVSIIKELAELPESLAKVFEVSRIAIIQRFVKGDEVSCGVLDTPNGRKALLPAHIKPKAGAFFDFESKYSEGGSDEIVPPNMPAEIISEIQQIALKAHEILGCEGYSRTDMIIRDEDKEIFVIETNSLPGLTEASIFPKEARADGISFPQLLDIIIQNAFNG